MLSSCRSVEPCGEDSRKAVHRVSGVGAMGATVGASVDGEQPPKRHQNGRGGRPSPESFPETVQRILARVRVSKSGCWLWQGAKDHAGYGQVRAWVPEVAA
jgi:hypothetical protein